MTEKKLRLALPLGKLVEPNKWNVASVLKQAGIINYQKGDRNVHAEILDPEIQPSFLKPRDIPAYLRKGVCDAGITGKDLVEENNLHLEELCDLDCGYVDLCFMTTQETWKKVQALWTPDQIERLQKNEIFPKAIELFLSYAYNLKLNSSEFKYQKSCLDTDNLKATCGTEYPLILKSISDELEFEGDLTPGRPVNNFLSDLDYAPKRAQVSLNEIRDLYKGELAEIEIFSAHGQTEQLLRDGAVDFILETVATGDSSKDFAVIEKVLDSTARMYKSLRLNQGDSWKLNKVQELKERIEGVKRDIKEYCQVKLILTEGETDRYRHRMVEHVLDRYGFSRNEPCLNTIIEKKELSTLKKFSEQLFLAGHAFTLDGFRGCLIPVKIECYDLQYLLRYCPTILGGGYMEDLTESWINESEDKWKTGMTLKSLELCKYPCTDTSKLRPEHRKQALLFQLPKEGSNP